MLTRTQERDIAAMASAKALGLGPTIFKYVDIGGKFSFQANGPVLTKISPRRYNDGSRTFSTGSRTAVFLR